MAQNWTIEQIEQRVRALDPWFHNLNLHGIQTAPDHFLGDFPRVLWPYVADVLSDVSGRTVLDVGCNAGFYAIEAKRRGARRVLGIDGQRQHVRQAVFVRKLLGLDIEY